MEHSGQMCSVLPCFKVVICVIVKDVRYMHVGRLVTYTLAEKLQPHTHRSTCKINMQASSYFMIRMTILMVYRDGCHLGVNISKVSRCRSKQKFRHDELNSTQEFPTGRLLTSHNNQFFGQEIHQ